MQRYGPTTALLVVDVQNDFADPAGSLSVRGGEAIVPRVDREIGWPSRHGALVVATQDWHPETHPAFRGGRRHLAGPLRGRHVGRSAPSGADTPRRRAASPQGRQRRGRLFGVHDARPAVAARPSRPSSRGSCATPASTASSVVGLATDYCVKATALDARRLGFETAVLADAIAAVDLQPGDGERALEEMRAAGVAIWQTVMR